MSHDVAGGDVVILAEVSVVAGIEEHDAAVGVITLHVGEENSAARFEGRVSFLNLGVHSSGEPGRVEAVVAPYLCGGVLRRGAVAEHSPILLAYAVFDDAGLGLVGCGIQFVIGLGFEVRVFEVGGGEVAADPLAVRGTVTVEYVEVAVILAGSL